MTTYRPKPTPSDDVADGADQCLLYLLGELDPQQTELFELRLESSPALCDELLSQASVISAWSAANGRNTRTAVVQSRLGHPLRWSIVATLVAVAACIALLLNGIRDVDSPTLTSTSEELLIAKAWVDNQHSGLTLLDGDLDLSLDRELDESDTVADEVSDVDATLAWLVPAVSAALNPDSSEGTHDG